MALVEVGEIAIDLELDCCAEALAFHVSLHEVASNRTIAQTDIGESKFDPVLLLIGQWNIR